MELRKNSAGGSVVVTTDGGAGSSGKGALNSWLADRFNFDVAINNWASNAGHFTEFDDGIRILNQHVCSSFINHSTQLYINAGASIDMDILFKEIDVIESHGWDIKSRLIIHPLANVITKEDKEDEARLIKSGSTFKGCGAALARKTMRAPGSKLARDYEELSPFIKDFTFTLNRMIAKGANVIIEGSQGIDLDINHAEYPHCTSRSCIPQQLITDAGIPFQAVSNVIINLRTNPIRINNQSAANSDEQCYSGNYWDAKEISWQDVAKQAGYETFDEFEKEYGFALMTSVTKKLRRVFEFPVERMREIHMMVGGDLPDSNVIYSLNFINFVDKNVKHVRNEALLMTPKVRRWLNENLFTVINRAQLKLVRTNSTHSDMVEL